MARVTETPAKYFTPVITEIDEWHLDHGALIMSSRSLASMWTLREVLRRACEADVLDQHVFNEVHQARAEFRRQLALDVHRLFSDDLPSEDFDRLAAQ
jgi:hypothetical protein